MSNFETDLARLCSCELMHARRDPTRGAAYLELLARQLALGVAVTCQGDPAGISTMLEGLTAHLFEAAADQASFGQFMAQLNRGADR